MDTNTEAPEKEDDPRVWYLPGPYFRYVENVKKLAKQHNLIIVDSNVTTGRNFAVEGPAVTLKTEYADSAKPVVHVAAPKPPATLAEAIAQMALVEKAAAAATPAPAFQVPAAIPAAPAPSPAPVSAPAPAVLTGSDKFTEATYEIGNGADDAQLGTIVAAAHARSGKTVDEWNKLKPAARNKLMTAELEIMRNDALAKSLTP